MKKINLSNLLYLLFFLLVVSITSCNRPAEETTQYLMVVPYYEYNMDDVEDMDDMGDGLWYILSLSDGSMRAVENSEGVQQTSQFYGDYATVSKFGPNYDIFYNYINTKGEFLNDSLYKWATVMKDDRAWVVSPGNYITLINGKGKEIKVMKDLEAAYPFSDGKSIVFTKEYKWMVVDRAGEYVDSIPYIPTTAIIANNSLFCRREGEKETNYGVYRLNSGEYSVSYDNLFGDNTLSNTINGLRGNKVIVKKDDRLGVINTEGEIIINPQFSSLLFDGDKYMFKKDRRWGWCSETGEYIVDPKYKEIKGFNGSNLAPAKDIDTGDWGYIDSEGTWIINPQYKEAESFEDNDLAIAQLGWDRGVINKEGKWVINPQYDFMYYFDGTGKYMVSTNNRKSYFLIDSKGKVVSEQFLCDLHYVVDREKKDNYEMLDNFGPAQNDYVDWSPLGEILQLMTNSMKSTTAGVLKEKLGEKAFKNGSVKIEEHYVNEFIVTLKADCNPWNRVSDGWFGYKNVFVPDRPVSTFKIVVESSIFADKYDLFESYLTKNFNYDEESSSLVINGKNFALHTNKKHTVVTFTLMD